MPRGSKKHYTDKQERKAEHIAEGYEERGVPEKEATARAWATVNAIHGGGELKGGSGYGKPENRGPSRRGGKKGAASRTRKTTRKGAAAKTSRAKKKRPAKKKSASKARSKPRR